MSQKTHPEILRCVVAMKVFSKKRNFLGLKKPGRFCYKKPFLITAKRHGRPG
jgi:hypothetical protein